MNLTIHHVIGFCPRLGPLSTPVLAREVWPKGWMGPTRSTGASLASAHSSAFGNKIVMGLFDVWDLTEPGSGGLPKKSEFNSGIFGAEP